MSESPMSSTASREALAHELQGSAITVNCIMPGAIQVEKEAVPRNWAMTRCARMKVSWVISSASCRLRSWEKTLAKMRPW